MNDALADAVAMLARAREAMLSVDLSSLSAGEMLRVGDAVEVDRHRAEAFDHQWIACLHGRGIPAEVGAPTTKALLVDRYRISPPEAG